MFPFMDDGNRLVGGSSANSCKIKTFYAWQALLNAKKNIDTIPGLCFTRLMLQQ